MENNFDEMPEKQDAQAEGQEMNTASGQGTEEGQKRGDAAGSSLYTDPNAGVNSSSYNEYQQPGQNYSESSYGQPGQSYGGGSGYGQPGQNYNGNSYGQPGQSYGAASYGQPEQNYSNTSYQQYQDNYNYNVGNNTGYSQNYDAGMDTAPMSMGDWIILLILMAIPCLNIILCCVWAFGKTGNVNRRNFCRAELIFIAIGIVISIIFAIIIATVGISGSTYYYY